MGTKSHCGIVESVLNSWRAGFKSRAGYGNSLGDGNGEPFLEHLGKLKNLIGTPQVRSDLMEHDSNVGTGHQILLPSLDPLYIVMPHHALLFTPTCSIYPHASGLN